MLENIPGLTEEQARAMMNGQFPKSKRWQAYRFGGYVSAERGPSP